MPDRDFKIRIVTESTGTGAQDANANLKELGRNVQTAGENTGFFNIHGREMHRLIHEIDRIAPGAGLSLRYFAHPTTLGIAATVLLLEQFVEHIRKAKEEADKAATAAATMWAAQAEAAHNYLGVISDVAASQDKLKEKYGEQKAILEAMIKLREALLGERFTGADAEEMRLNQVTQQYQGRQETNASLQDSLIGLGGDNGQKIGAARSRMEGKTLAEMKKASDVASAKIDAELNAYQFQVIGPYSAQQREADRAKMVAGPEGEAIHAFGQFRQDSDLVQKYNETQKALDENTAAMKALHQQWLELKSALPIHRQTEALAGAEKALGVQDAAGLVPLLYQNMGQGQQAAMMNVLRQGNENSNRLLKMMVEYILSHQKQIEDMQKALDRKGK